MFGLLVAFVATFILFEIFARIHEKSCTCPPSYQGREAVISFEAKVQAAVAHKLEELASLQDENSCKCGLTEKELDVADAEVQFDFPQESDELTHLRKENAKLRARCRALCDEADALANQALAAESAIDELWSKHIQTPILDKLCKESE